MERMREIAIAHAERSSTEHFLHTLHTFGGIFLAMTLLSFSGCSAQQKLNEACRNKISPSVVTFLSDSLNSSGINLIITLNDTTGIGEIFPSIRIANAKIALGHFSKGEIALLCKHKNVVYIETPKKLFPK